MTPPRADVDVRYEHDLYARFLIDKGFRHLRDREEEPPAVELRVRVTP